MSKFFRLLSKTTSILLTTVILFSSTQVSVFAETDNSQTGTTVLTESGAGLDITNNENKLETSTGNILINSGTGSEIQQLLQETGSDLLQTEESITETGAVIKINEKEIKKDEKQVKIEKEVEFKKQWSDDEVIALGYVPGEIVIKFKKDQVDLEKASGKQKMKNFISSNSVDTAEDVMQKVSSKKAELGKKLSV